MNNSYHGENCPRSYNSNLLGTIHPRINVAIEPEMKNDELQSLLSFIKDAIVNNDYQTLFENIAKVCPGVSDINTSTDTFIKKDDAELSKGLLIQLNPKNKTT